MGYVLPVSHFQYQDYKHRITLDKQNKFYVNRPQKSVLERAYQDMKANTAYNRKERKRNRRYILERYDDALYAEITGKGRYVSEWV